MTMEKSCCSAKTAEVEKAGLVESIAFYKPLLILTALAMFVALALDHGRGVPFMPGFMGMALLFLSALKLFGLNGFAAAFARYDIVAARIRAYGLAYPFIELALGLLLLGGFKPLATNIAVLALFGIGTIGVYRIVRSGEKVQCGCVGTGFNLPVGNVTLAENIVMMTMAAVEIALCIH